MKDNREAWSAVLLLFFASIEPSFSQRTPSPSSATTGGTEPSLMQLVWSDEFNEEVVDAQKWTIFNGDGCGSQLGCGWGTEQLGTSSPTNVGIDNGHLVITVRHNSNTDDTWSSSSERATSSGRVSTAGSANFVYGRIDVRAKVPLKGWGGLAGVWLVPSQDIPRGDSPSCSRVDVMEVRDLQMSAVSAGLHFGSIDQGCISSSTWPVDGGSCLAFPPNLERELSDGFHVYSVDWEEGQFRWYLDGWHYCTKTSWPSESDGYPSLFDKAFHVEIGLGVLRRDKSLKTNEFHEAPLPQEMVIDYVRIFQAPSGRWWTPTRIFSTDGTNRQGPWFFVSMDTLALAACVVGPYMAITGISRPRTNTMLLGMETGAFKAANVVYIVNGSAVAAFPVSVVFSLLTGWLALRSSAVARANTVAGLAVPFLFVLIDVGMIADIGSRYVCWAIFLVLTVTFGVLAFLPENQSIMFTVATGASGGCVFKLGIGWLLRVPGEIFKLLDDPLGDTCSISRTCRSLTWVSAATFVCGILSQLYLDATSSSKRLLNLGTGGSAQRSDKFNGDNTKNPLFAASLPKEEPMKRKRQVLDAGGWRRRSGSFSTENHGNKSTYAKVCALGDQPSDEDRDKAQGPRKADHGPKRDLPAVFSGWKPLLEGIKSILRKVGGPTSSQESTNATPPNATSVLDSPTPVPMPAANTVVSTNGDTISLVIHSPTKPLPYKYSCVGTRGEWRGGKEEAIIVEAKGNLAGGAGYPRLRLPVSETKDERASHLFPDSLPPATMPHALSSPSLAGRAELIDQNDSENENVISRERTSLPDHGHNRNNGRFAQAFSQKWGTWANSECPSVRGKGESGARTQKQDGRQHENDTEETSRLSESWDNIDVTPPGARGASEFNHEALTISPYDPHPGHQSVRRTPPTATSSRSGVSASLHSSISVADSSDPTFLNCGKSSPFEPSGFAANTANMFPTTRTYCDGDGDDNDFVDSLDLNDHSEILPEKTRSGGPARLSLLRIFSKTTADGDGSGGGNDVGGRSGGQMKSAHGNAQNGRFAHVASKHVASDVARVAGHDVAGRVNEKNRTHERETTGLGSAVKGHSNYRLERDDGRKRRSRSPQSKRGRTNSPRQEITLTGRGARLKGHMKPAGDTRYGMELTPPPSPIGVNKNDPSSSSRSAMVDNSPARGDNPADYPDVSPRGRGRWRRSTGMPSPRTVGL